MGPRLQGSWVRVEPRFQVKLAEREESIAYRRQLFPMHFYKLPNICTIDLDSLIFHRL